MAKWYARLAKFAQLLDASGTPPAADPASHTHSGGDIDSGTVADARIASTIARDSELPDLAGHVAAGDPHTGYQKESEKGSASGYASLDGSGVVPDAQLPAGLARDSEVTAAIGAEATARDVAIAAAITALVGTAASALDTLGELSDALGDDASFASTVTTALAGKQAIHANLTALAGLTGAADKLPYFTGSGAMALVDLSSFIRTLLNDADAATARATIGIGAADAPEILAINVGHASDTTLTRLSAGELAVEGQRIMRIGGADLPVADGGTGASDAAGARAALGLVIGTDVQARDADLDAIAALTPTNDDVVQRKAGAWTNRSMSQLLSDLAAVPTSRSIGNGYGISGGGNLTADRTLAVALSSASARLATAQSISAAAYADLTGCSVSLAAGTWLIFATMPCSAANLAFQAHLAITDNANAIQGEGSGGAPASGTASVHQWTTVVAWALVTPGSTTTYKLRAARGNTTLTNSYTAQDGAGVAVANNASDASDKGTGLVAVRIL